VNHPDAYRSVNLTAAHEFIVLVYTAGSALRVFKVEADCYTDAVGQVAPGNDAIKIEVIAA
jgi:hypothetical protein